MEEGRGFMGAEGWLLLVVEVARMVVVLVVVAGVGEEGAAAAAVTAAVTGGVVGAVVGEMVVATGLVLGLLAMAEEAGYPREESSLGDAGCWTRGFGGGCCRGGAVAVNGERGLVLLREDADSAIGEAGRSRSLELRESFVRFFFNKLPRPRMEHQTRGLGCFAGRLQ